MFKKVLVANRGEVACRILRTCHQLGLKTAAVFSDADVHAPHVALADEAFRLGAAPVQQSYLNLDALLEAIRLSGADAVHPGYGLLSESASFAQAVLDAGVSFVGPSPSALQRLGDKIQARALARGVGFEPPPGTEQAVTREQALEQAQGIGFPLLVKAAAGGGGIGMQLVQNLHELERAFATAATRAKAAFGDERLYLERYLEAPKHIELQLVRDQHGQSIAYGERECSVQRRHQKIIEESGSPAPALATAQGQKHLEEQIARAHKLLEACDYVGLATLEFVMDSEGRLFFLEVNARLQVEHPVTELRSGLDLVQAQLVVASGQRLGTSWSKLQLSGYALEARIYAEDPYKQFVPQPGRIVELELPKGEGVRVDSGVNEGAEITPYYDPLLLKVAVHANTRTQAIERLDEALATMVLRVEGKRGPRTTNQEFLRRVLHAPAFRSGSYTTHLVEQLLEAGA